MRVNPVPPDDLTPELRALHDGAPKEGQRRIIRVTGHAPEHAERYWPFYNAVRFDNSLGARLNELIRVAAASTTECDVCLGSQRDGDGADVGSAGQKLDASADGRTEAERLVIAYVTLLGTDHLAIDETMFIGLHEHFSEREIVEISMLATQFIAMGRLSAVLQLEELVCELRPRDVAV